MASMSDRRQALLEMPHVRGRLTVADSIALHHRQGLSKASCFASTVDPWCYSEDEDGNEEPSQWNVKRYVQKVVDQSAHAARNLSDFTASGKNEPEAASHPKNGRREKNTTMCFCRRKSSWWCSSLIRVCFRCCVSSGARYRKASHAIFIYDSLSELC